MNKSFYRIKIDTKFGSTATNFVLKSKKNKKFIFFQLVELSLDVDVYLINTKVLQLVWINVHSATNMFPNMSHISATSGDICAFKHAF